MDAMGFGMGCCCLQQTFQACNVNEARRIYDSFVPLAPVLVSTKVQHPATTESMFSWHLLLLAPCGGAISQTLTVGGTLLPAASTTVQKKNVA